MAVDNLVIIIIIIVINVQLFLLARIFVMIRDVKERVGYNYYRLKEVEFFVQQNRNLLYKVHDLQGIISGGGATSESPLPIEENSLCWICAYCGKMEDNLMSQLACTHCGAERQESTEDERESSPYFEPNGGVSVMPDIMTVPKGWVG